MPESCKQKRFGCVNEAIFMVMKAPIGEPAYICWTCLPRYIQNCTSYGKPALVQPIGHL